MRAVGRVIVALIGFMIAAIAAALFLMFARLGPQPAAPDALILYWTRAALGLGLAASSIGAAALAPSLVAIIFAEALHIRSIVYYLAVGAGLSGAAILGLSEIMRPAVGAPERATLLLAAGVVAGAVYWMVAGRTAGLTDRREPKRQDLPPESHG